MRGHNPSDPIVGATVRQLSTGRVAVVAMPGKGAIVQMFWLDCLFPTSPQAESIPDWDLELVEKSPLRRLTARAR